MIVYTAGWNMPGYLPETDPEAFESRPEALAYIVGELRRCADNFGGGSGADEYEQAADSLEGRDAEGGDWYGTFEDGRIAYWFEAVDLPDEDARAFLAAEH